MKTTIKFYFEFNSQIWYWSKTFHGEINDTRIQQYLEQKTLPFELPSTLIKYKR